MSLMSWRRLRRSERDSRRSLTHCRADELAGDFGVIYFLGVCDGDCQLPARPPGHWRFAVPGLGLATRWHDTDGDCIRGHRRRAIDTLKRQRDRMMAGLPAQLRIDLISARSRQQWWGNVPAHVLPPVLFLLWAAAYAFVLS